MKNYFKFRFMLLSIAALGLFSCADKLIDDNVAQSQEGQNDGFIAFEISSVDNLTRADAEMREENGKVVGENDYDKGDVAKEYEITTERGANVVFFFNANGSFQGKSYLQLMANGDSDHNGSYDGDQAKEQVYSASLRKTKNNELLYAVLILNAQPSQLEELVSGFNTPSTNTDDLNTFMEKIEVESSQKKLGQYGEYFTMSNTIYVEEIEGKKTLHGPEKIEANQIKDTWEEANKDENKVKVHVERVVAKFELTFNTKNTSASILTDNQLVITATENQLPIRKMLTSTDATDGSNSTTTTFADGKSGKWGIRIKGWNMNGIETQTYWMKNLGDGSNLAANAKYPTVTIPGDGKFGYWAYDYTANSKGWNDVTRVRSYWAVDPHYNSYDGTSEASYPQQYRDAEPNSGVIAGHGTGYDGTAGANYDFAGTNVLKYISYEEIIEENPKYRYAPENTFGEYEEEFFTRSDDEKFQFQGNAYKRTSTHILVAAELLIDGETESESEPVDKYCYGGVYWTPEVAGADNANLIKFMVEQLLDYIGIPLYSSDNTQFTADKATDFFELVKATITGGDGRLMLALKNGKKLYTTSTVSDDTEYDLSNDIFAVGTVKHFNKGKMYYAIPIEHMVAYSKVADEAEKWNIGSYGVVRNHWYKVNVSTISKPGIPVDEPDQPIIPNDEPDEPGYVAFEIVIVPWHVIEQDVTF